MNTPSLDDLIELGAVQDAQGLQGQIKVRPHSSDPVALLSSKELWLSLIPRRNAVVATSPEQASLKLYKVKQAKMHSGTVVIALDGITDRDQAEALKGARILVARDVFPGTDEDSYYWVDLIGCKAVNIQGDNLGEVIDVNDNGAHGIIVLGDSETKTVKQLVPFVKEAVQNVDLPNRLITLDWQPDW
ncbi:ribosome maturation factor RimM [Polynucleobacter sp. UK-Mo-2m-Kol15]|uniref:ribosome maturation factor RimM n=1 Tax=Polynucleobacter sp. UK-Mo-2m-Kol15 TaxID=2576916 RepID=UPI001C0CAB4E|nr:ribosome maturation factor RimM [Polynucleobacter sp. UK-Mo-2m-Kol15]MBU3575146.1 ribosome maturation factor RimM [Polynucleobacter sp. UK-Mo-2m-Kol15]